jgi:hypothetical protein
MPPCRLHRSLRRCCRRFYHERLQNLLAHHRGKAMRAACASSPSLGDADVLPFPSPPMAVGGGGDDGSPASGETNPEPASVSPSPSVSSSVGVCGGVSLPCSVDGVAAVVVVTPLPAATGREIAPSKLPPPPATTVVLGGGVSISPGALSLPTSTTARASDSHSPPLNIGR